MCHLVLSSSEVLASKAHNCICFQIICNYVEIINNYVNISHNCDYAPYVLLPTASLCQKYIITVMWEIYNLQLWAHHCNHVPLS